MGTLDEEQSNDTQHVEVLAVVPSIGSPGLEAVGILQQKLDAIESVSCVIVSNSKTLSRYLESLSVSFLSDGSNGGFGRSIRMGAESSSSWSWLLIVNDDISLDADAFAAALRVYLSNQDKLREIVYFDEDKLRKIPQRMDVFLQVSLIGKLLDKFRRGKISEVMSYRSFSCVAISRELFEAADGFDEDLIFTYEDADFVARANELGAIQKCATESGVIHAHSVSSGRHVDKVLPVATYSAARYLDKRSGSFAGNTAVILLALVFRIFFVPFTSAKKKTHVRGILASAMSVIRRSQNMPYLPEYTKL